MMLPTSIVSLVLLKRRAIPLTFVGFSMSSTCYERNYSKHVSTSGVVKRAATAGQSGLPCLGTRKDTTGLQRISGATSTSKECLINAEKEIGSSNTTYSQYDF